MLLAEPRPEISYPSYPIHPVPPIDLCATSVSDSINHVLPITHYFFKVASIKPIRGNILKKNGRIGGKIVRALAKRRSKRKDKAQHNSYFTGGKKLIPVTNIPFNFQERLMGELKELHLLAVPVGMMAMPSGKA